MKMLFIVNMDESVKGGLFIATHNRIKEYRKFKEFSFEVLNVVKYDSWFLTLIKKLLKRKVLKRTSDSFVYDEIKYKNLYIKETLLTKISLKLGFDFHLKKVIKENNINGKYDIISAHWGGYPQGCIAYLFKKFNKIPYVLTFHGSDIHTYPAKSKGNKKLVLRNIQGAGAVFFVSKKLKSQAQKLDKDSNTKKYCISYNSSNPKLFYPLSMVEINNLKNKKKISNYVVGFVGNLNRTKRADMLIRIFSEIQKKVDQHITFLIIGDGELRKKIEKEIELTNLDVRITGRLNQSDLNIYYNIMDCLILPSRNEGLGNVVLEAQTCNVPVIATNTGGIPEVIGNKKLLVQNDDQSIPSEISNKISELFLNIPGNVKTNAYSISWKEVVEKEIEVFDAVLNTSEDILS